MKILKANVGSVLECQGQEEILAAEKRLKEIDCARNDLVGLIASGGCDEDSLTVNLKSFIRKNSS